LINFESLEQEFLAVRAGQFRDKVRTGYDRAVEIAILAAVRTAWDDQANKREHIAFRLCSAQTGSGKSMSALALMAAGANARGTVGPFSAAYVLPTVELCEEMRKALAAQLNNPADLVCYTNAHNKTRLQDPAYRQRVQARYGFIPSVQCDPGEMRRARLVITTHETWMNDVTQRRNLGVREFGERRRTVVFVDERPDLVKLIERTPGDVRKLYDSVYRTDANHPWLPVIKKAYDNMSAVFEVDAPFFMSVDLVPSAAFYQFAKVNQDDLKPFVQKGANPRNEGSDLWLTLQFLAAASRGSVFLCRTKPISFVAYVLEFSPGAGTVLLDATSDLSGFSALLPGVEPVEVPPVDYSQLRTFSGEVPRQFRDVSEVCDTADLARVYGDWMMTEVMSNTRPGDDLLVVGHKGIIDPGYFPKALDAAKPTVIDGRRINSIWWGSGIGSNAWKDKRLLFTFHEFYIPRRAVVATALGLADTMATTDTLQGANTAELQGSFLTAYEGHLLRWRRQIVARGNVRNIDGNGVAGEMTWYTYGDTDLLTKAFPRMFPGQRRQSGSKVRTKTRPSGIEVRMG
jgi:hypothetical protein